MIKCLHHGLPERLVAGTALAVNCGNKKPSYLSCRFLFDSEETYESSVTNESEVDNKIIELLNKKIDEISQNVKTGRELRKRNQSSRDIWYICHISVPGQKISTNRENRLKEFVTERKALNREYEKQKIFHDTYKSFLISYILQARQQELENPYYSDYYRLPE